MTAQIDVSVIIAAWRAGGFIDKAIASALASTDVTVEVIAVDDASPDDTFAILSRMAEVDPRVVALQLEKNAGPSGARNKAIEAARGRYVAVLDADDVIAPGRLAESKRPVLPRREEARCQDQVNLKLELGEDRRAHVERFPGGKPCPEVTGLAVKRLYPGSGLDGDRRVPFHSRNHPADRVLRPLAGGHELRVAGNDRRAAELRFLLDEDDPLSDSGKGVGSREARGAGADD